MSIDLKQLKIGDSLVILKAGPDRDKIGQTREIIGIEKGSDFTRFTLEGCKFSWNLKNDAIDFYFALPELSPVKKYFSSLKQRVL